MEPRAFDRMRDLVVVSAGTNVPVGVAALLLVATVDPAGGWGDFLLGTAVGAIAGALPMLFLWWRLHRMRSEAPLPETASVRTQREILAGSATGLLLWAGFAILFTLLFGVTLAGVVVGVTLVAPSYLLPIAWTERRRSCEIFIAAERSAERSQAATRYWTR
jgi:hypothetical protein